MKITNKQGFPDIVARAVANKRYDRGESDVTVTQLVNPTRVTVLKERHGGELAEDVADRVWALLGEAVHVVLERAGAESEITERRLYMDVLGYKVGGQFDALILADDLLVDHKITSAWCKGEPKPDWIAQLNLLRLLAEANGYTINALGNMLFYRDWSRAKAAQDSSYPQKQSQFVKVSVWSIEDAMEYAQDRVAKWADAQKLADTQLPFCTDDERWAKGGEFAVMKKGRKSAMRLLQTRAEAEEWARANGGGQLYIEQRPKTYPRCESYCEVAGYCNQWNRR